MEKKFITSVSMEVTDHQYMNDLQKPLMKLGYTLDSCQTYFDKKNCILNTNWNKNNSSLGISDKRHMRVRANYFIGHYNPKLFLALAAMIEGHETSFYNDEYFICTRSWDNEGEQISVGEITNDIGTKYNRNIYRKLTKEEVLAYFLHKDSTKKEFKEGGWVVALENSGHAYTKGFIYQVRRAAVGTIYTMVDDKGSASNGWGKEYFRLATNEEIEKHLAIPEKWYFDVTPETAELCVKLHRKLCNSSSYLDLFQRRISKEVRTTLLSVHPRDHSCYYEGSITAFQLLPVAPDYKELTLKQLKFLVGEAGTPFSVGNNSNSLNNGHERSGEQSSEISTVVENGKLRGKTVKPRFPKRKEAVRGRLTQGKRCSRRSRRQIGRGDVQSGRSVQQRRSSKLP